MVMSSLAARPPSSRRPAPPQSTSRTSAHGGLLQRKCARGGTTGIDGECAESREDGLGLQRRAANPDNLAPVPSIVDEVPRSPGRPLDLSIRSDPEPGLGHDFSRVRIHTDAKAEGLARSPDALAWTVSRSDPKTIAQHPAAPPDRTVPRRDDE